MAPLELQARPLRRGLSRVVLASTVLPGLALAAAHAPWVLLLLGPLGVMAWSVARRDRRLVDEARVRLSGPALTLWAGQRRLLGVDLRWARWRETEAEGQTLMVWDQPGRYLIFGEDPPVDAYVIDGEDVVVEWLPVRLLAADLQALRAALSRWPSPLPEPQTAEELLAALGSAGAQGPRAERLLRERVAERDAGCGGRPEALRVALQELALREDDAGLAARRVLAP